MDKDTLELIQALCTRAGMIMEDASAEAVMMPAIGVSATGEKLAELAGAVEAASSILLAAQVLWELEQDEPTPS